MVQNLIAYVAVVSLGGVACLIWALRWLRDAEASRKSRLTGRTWFEGILTKTPLDDPMQETRQQGLDNIRRHSTVIRRTLIPMILFVTGLLACVPLLGELPTALVSIVVGLVSVATGIAARPVLENVFSGLVISFSKLINIGDTVTIDEEYGTVEDVTLTHTTIRIWNWQRYVVPNSRVLQSPVRNYSLHDRYLWAHVEFWVSYEADLEVVKSLAIESACASSSYASHEPPRFWVMELGERGIQCWVAAWADTPSSGWSLKNDIRTSLAHGMQRQGLFPHLLRFVDVANEPTAVSGA